ncbi:oligosaccharide flippase family protein [Solibacillus silvestris]
MSLNKAKLLLNSKVAQNGSWLYLLQVFNMVVPLITLPYITRVLGSSQYGIFAFSLNLIGYFQVLVEYGFNLTGSRKVVVAKDKTEISKIYSVITTTKISICTFTFFLMIFISFLLKIDFTQFSSLILLYMIIIGSALQQSWLFQGLQEMKYITIINVISRTLSVILIFIFIKDPSQIYLYCILYSFTFLLNGIISIFIISKKFRIRYKMPKFSDIIIELKDGWYIFTTSAMTQIFSGIGITILGLTSTEKNVGIYSAIQKIPLIITMMYAPISQAIYPYVSKNYTISLEKGIGIVKKTSIIIMPIILIISLGLLLGSNFLVEILFGSEYSSYSNILIPLTVWMIFSISNNFLGIQILVASGHQKDYSGAFKIGIGAIIITNLTLGVYFGLYGVAYAAMISEIVLTIAIILKIKKITL